MEGDTMPRDLTQDFYECPDTGELVYRWSARGRMVLMPALEARRLRAIAEAATWSGQGLRPPGDLPGHQP